MTTTHDSSERRWQTVAVSSLLFGIAAVAFVAGVAQTYYFSVRQILVLGVAVTISLIVNRYRSKIPGTSIEFSAKDIFTFWGLIWLGIGGGVVLAASASLARFIRPKNGRRPRIVEIYADIISAVSAGAIFYLVLGLLVATDGKLSGTIKFASDGMLAATYMMVLTHYLVNGLLMYIPYRADGGRSVRQLLIERFAYPAVAYFLSLVATMVLYIAFVQFGIEFGLVLVPIAVIGDLAYRIHTRRLAQKTKQITDASRVHLATVEALATAIDARDQVGRGHVRRTQIYAIGLGETLGLPESDISALRTGALLHDIGKLAVPDHILNKPGRLTPAEMEKTKIHVSVGASILEKVGFDYPVVPTVKYHHERWDGAGYPEGLKGEAIPLTARILCVADAFDTLRGARPYRPPVSRLDASEFLRNGAGTQFDPKVVSVFLRNLKSYESQIDAEELSYAGDRHFYQDPGTISMHNGDLGYVEQIKRANREVFTLYELAREFGSSVNLQDTIELFSQKVSEFVSYDTCAVFLLNDKAESATAVHVQGMNKKILTGITVRPGDGATGTVLSGRQCVRNADPVLDLALSAVEADTEYITMMSLPLIADEKLIGAVSLYSAQLAAYGEEDMRLLETISRIAADAIDKSIQHAEAEAFAMTDPMTGLPNARHLKLHFDREVGRANRGDSTFQVLMLDLDGFKSVNDNFGHKAGDRMLKEVGGVIRGQLRDYDFLARYAGDEFVAIIPETTSEDVRELCRRIEFAVSDFCLPAGTDVARVGVSIGAAGFPHNGKDFDQMIIAADKAMYAAKSARKQWEKRPIPRPDDTLTDDYSGLAPLPEYISASETAETAPADNIIVELDETHIVSTAVN